MPVVFRFDSMDHRSQAMLVLPSIEAAIDHLRTAFRLSDYWMDEDEHEQVSFKRIKAMLGSYQTVRLYERDSYADDVVEISCASG